jgi:hypothetical protein
MLLALAHPHDAGDGHQRIGVALEYISDGWHAASLDSTACRRRWPAGGGYREKKEK